MASLFLETRNIEGLEYIVVNGDIAFWKWTKKALMNFLGFASMTSFHVSSNNPISSSMTSRKGSLEEGRL